MISVNPYKRISKRVSPVGPDLCVLAGEAYSCMVREGKPQSIIISGESGAGKTEATKKILEFIATIQESASDVSIEKQVLRANPILEAFGNAKTVRNDNSSRFGKYIHIEFSSTGKVESANIRNYLLEQCRITQQQPEERNFHAFYQLLASEEEMFLQPPETFAITQTTELENVDDGEEFLIVKDCMVRLGFQKQEMVTIWKIVSAVLHLGNLLFVEGKETQIENKGTATIIAELLSLKEENLENVFRWKTLEVQQKVINRVQQVDDASNTR